MFILELESWGGSNNSGLSSSESFTLTSNLYLNITEPSLEYFTHEHDQIANLKSLSGEVGQHDQTVQ